MDVYVDNFYALGFGFSNTPATTNGSFVANVPYMPFQAVDATSPWKVEAEPVAFGGWNDTGVTIPRVTFTPVSIVLDTRASNWTASWYVGSGSTPVYTHTYTNAEGNPTIGYIELEHANWSGGNVDNLTLSSVPEPSAVVLLITGLVALLAYAWRRRR